MINNTSFNNYNKNTLASLKNDPKMLLAKALNRDDALRGARNYIEVMGEGDIENFCKYINGIDFDKLYKLAPEIKEYDSKKLLTFLDYYYKNGINKFSKETLTFKGDLTKFLSKNYINATDLESLLTLFPLTNRAVGSVPAGWLQNIPEGKKKETVEKIYNAISEFQNKKLKSYNDRLEFANNLQNILAQKVEVEKLKGGAYGECVRIISEYADNVCLKTYQANYLPYSVINKHGQFIEPQTGLFANYHSNAFVKELFARVSDVSHPDGFIATQYLDEGIKPQKGSFFSKGYKVISTDVYKHERGILSDLISPVSKNHNKINGKIIDFGGVEINKKFFKNIFDILFGKIKDYSKYYIGHK